MVAGEGVSDSNLTGWLMADKEIWLIAGLAEQVR